MFLLCFYNAVLSSQTLLGLYETDPLIAASLCLFCLTQSLWALYKCLAQFLPLPSPSTSPSHSAILRASLATSSACDSAVAATSAVVLIHLDKYLPPFSRVAL